MKKYITYTYDIFDTLFSRIYKFPEELYIAVYERYKEKELASQSNAFLFQKLRKIAEKKARDSQPENQNEVTLPEIYKFLPGFSEEEKENLLELELELEKEGSIPIRKNLSELLGRKNKLLISDMYLDTEFLWNLGKKHNLDLSRDQYIVSSDWNAKKTDGKLFQKLKEGRFIHKPWVHKGDSFLSDFLSVKQKGGKAIYDSGYRTGAWNRWLDRPFPSSNIYTDFLNLERKIKTWKFQTNSKSDLETGLLLSYANCISPFLAGFSAWLASELEKGNIKKIYFLSRDGHSLWKFFSSFTSGKGFDSDYLQCSRLVLILAGLEKKGKSGIQELCGRGDANSIRILTEKLGIEEESSRVSQEFQIPEEEFLTDKDLNKIIDYLWEEYSDLILSFARSIREKYLDYLRSRLGEEGKIAFIDIGWTGSTQLSWEMLCQSELPGLDISYFYVFLRKERPFFTGNSVHAYVLEEFFEPKYLSGDPKDYGNSHLSQLDGRIIFDNIPLVEKILCYHSQPGLSIQDLLENRLNFEEVIKDPILQDQQMELADQAATYLMDLGRLYRNHSLILGSEFWIRTTIQNLIHYIHSPKSEYISYLRGESISYDSLNRSMLPLIRKISFLSLGRIVVKRLSRRSVSRMDLGAYWIEASLRISGIFVRASFGLGKNLKGLLISTKQYSKNITKKFILKILSEKESLI
jgi:hypothetical protein